MRSTVKTILAWMLILLAAIALYNMVENRGTTRTSLDLTAFLARVDNGGVTDVSVSGNLLRGHLSDGQVFTTTIPAENAAIYERLIAKGVSVRILPPESAATEALPRVLILGGLVVWLAISAVILVLLVDLSRVIKRQLARTSGTGSVA